MRASAFLVVFLFATLAGSAPPADTGQDWPQWRGPNRDAVSAETGLVDRWPEAGPRVVWRIDVGAGFSSPSVVDGKLYTLWDEKDGQYLVGVDARTGKQRWRRRLGPAFTNNYGNGPRSTPLVDEGVVFTVGTQGHLVAVTQAGGELLWEHDLVQRFGAKLPSYGYASSPLVAGDKLVVEVGGANAAFMAFDKKSGEVVWSSQNDPVAYSSPIAVSIGGARQVVFWSANGLRAVSPEDGHLLWSHEWQTLCPVTGDPLNTGTPIFIAPDRIFVSSGSGAAVLRIARAGEGFKVETVWKSERMRSDVNTAVLLGNYVYGFNRGILQCVDVRTGEIRWQARGFKRGSLIAADGKLIVLGESGNLAIAKASPDGFVEQASAQVLNGRNWSSPSLARGRLYARNHDELVCLDLRARTD